jgi:hypothetical protein
MLIHQERSIHGALRPEGSREKQASSGFKQTYSSEFPPAEYFIFDKIKYSFKGR